MSSIPIRIIINYNFINFWSKVRGIYSFPIQSSGTLYKVLLLPQPSVFPEDSKWEI